MRHDTSYQAIIRTNANAIKQKLSLKIFDNEYSMFYISHGTAAEFVCRASTHMRRHMAESTLRYHSGAAFLVPDDLQIIKLIKNKQLVGYFTVTKSDTAKITDELYQFLISTSSQLSQAERDQHHVHSRRAQVLQVRQHDDQKPQSSKFVQSRTHASYPAPKRSNHTDSDWSAEAVVLLNDCADLA